jgi:hypothetical protein
MIKKLFDWTPRDIAYWEKIQHKGLGNFIIIYGVVLTGGGLFIIFGLATVVSWLWKTPGVPLTHTRLIFMAGQLLFIGLVCLVCGVINSLITWAVEQRLYRKYKGGG